MTVRHIVQLLLIAIFGAATACAQTLVVYNVDASGFPTIKANFIVLDAQGRRIPSVSASDFAIVEDGIAATDITVSCPPYQPPQPFNAVLVNDKSGSMWMLVNGTTSRLDLAKMGSSEFVQLTDFASGSSVAVTAFESSASIIADFQTSRPPLLNAISTITSGGGTLYNPPFIDPLAGAIGMLAARNDNLRRVIVFLTDGEPNEPTLVNEIVVAATAARVEVYSVTIGMPMNNELRVISARTNGEAFGDIWTVDQIRGVYQQIALASGGTKACEITWRSQVRCGDASRNRSVTITYKPNGATGRVSFLAPASSVGGITASPSFLNFGSIGPPDSVDRLITISSPNDSLRIDRAVIVPAGTFRVIDWGGPPPPIREPAGAKRTITVRMVPQDSQKYIASLVLYGTPCPPYPITLTGGVGEDDGVSLKLISPLGGEMFADCDSVLIRWGGVAEATPIKIEASGDDGLTWFTIAVDATGFAYRWMPPGPGDKWRIRISAATGDEQHTITTLAGGGSQAIGNGPARQLILHSPSGVAVRGDSMYIAEAGAHQIRRVDMRTGMMRTIAGDGQPGYNDEGLAAYTRLNNPSHVLLYGNYLFIADYANHRVRRINLLTGLIQTIAGTGESGYAGEGVNAVSAVLRFPSHLAINGTYLYVNDAGNSRIRRIELASGTITTVAGGGASTADEIPPTDAMLNQPGGITADDRYLYIAESGARKIRRVDLSSNLITTIAGTGWDASTGDGGQAAVATFKRPVGVELAGDALLVVDSAAQRVRRIDLASGMISAVAGTGGEGFSGDDGDALMATFSGPGQPAADAGILYVPDVHNGRIRAITLERLPASDASRSAFAINVAQLRVSGLRNDAFAFGQLAVGQSIDSSVSGVLCSVGANALIIDSARVIGSHASDFVVVSGAPSSSIDTGTCAPLEVRFRPSAVGVRTAMIVLYGRCANADTVLVTGIGISPCGVSVVDFTDVGEIVLGAATRDTIIDRAICNTDATALRGNARLVSGAQAFEIIAGGGPFTIASGQCHTVRIRFAPTITGRVTGDIDYGIPASCGAARTRLYGRALGAPELVAPDLIAWSADMCGIARDTSIVIRNNGGAPLEITSIRFVSNDEGFSLTTPTPSSTAPLVIVPGDSNLIGLRFAAAQSGAKSATIEIVSNAIGSPHRLVLNGRRERIAVSSDQLVAFPADGVALPRDTIVRITNNGSVDVTVTSIALSGIDAASYAVPAGQTPLTIAAGASADVRIRLLVAPIDRALHARLELTYGPTCDSGSIHVSLVAAGTGPELLSFGPVFAPLICADEIACDTVIVIGNVGATALVMTRATIVNDTAGVFSIVPAMPLSVASGADTTLVVRFAAIRAGVYGAELRIESNTRDGITIIPLIGRREAVGLTSPLASINLGPIKPGASTSSPIGIANEGTIALDLSMTTSTGVVSIESPTTMTLGAGGTAAVNVRFDATAGGRAYDTLVIRTEPCGLVLRIPIQTDVILPVAAHITLPNQTARPGQRVALPVAITITDSMLFAGSGASGYTASVAMYGTVVVPDSIVGATLIANDYDMKTRMQTIVFSGNYNGSDTLGWILGRALLGDTLATPLRLVAFMWDKPVVGVTSTDGSVIVVGSCLDIPLRIVATPRILKLRPMPARDRATLELSAEEWINARVAIYDSRGIAVASIAERMIDAGESSIELDLSSIAPGAYTLTVETVYGRDALPIVVQR